MNLWSSIWLPRKMTLTIRGDNKAALSIAARLEVAKNSSLIGKEMAWIFTQAAFHPRYVQHVPGVTNVLADALSRITDPTKQYKIPANDWQSLELGIVSVSANRAIRGMHRD